MKSIDKTFVEGLITAVFCLWCLFWMIQPAIYCPKIMEQRWLGFPAHYAFWLVGMVIAIPASCFFYSVWADRREKTSRGDKRRI